MIKHLLLAACLSATALGAVAQIHEQNGDSITPPADVRNEVGVYYRITSLSYATVELAGFITGQEREAIEVPQQIYDTISGRYFKVTSVAPDAFKGHKELRTVKLPVTVTRIGSSAFQDCSIEDAQVPGSVYHVETNAYAGCPLKEVHIWSPGVDGSPAKTTHSIELQDGAFGAADDATLKDVYITYATPPVVEDGQVPFPHVAAHNSSATLHLADGVDDQPYRDAYCWEDFYKPDTSAITDITGDDSTAPARYYTLDGLEVGATNLHRGLYIVRRGNHVSKTLVR